MVQDFSAGFGVKYTNISVDYGYGAFNSELNAMFTLLV